MPEWLDVPSPWIDLPGRLRAPCREGEDAADVRKAIGSGDSGRPYLVDNQTFRELHFTRHKPHSLMRIADPTALVMAYTRKMMAFLLFVPRPNRILILGLGGGAMVKYCYRHLSGASVVVVEPDADVFSMREAFFLPQDDDRLRIVQQSSAEFVAQDVHQYDVILVDNQDAGLPSSGGRGRFYHDLARRLSPHGCLVLHLNGDEDPLVVHTGLAQSLPDTQLVQLSLANSGSTLLYGLRQPVLQSAPESMESAARRLQRALQLDFPDYLYRINESARAGSLRGVSEMK